MDNDRISYIEMLDGIRAISVLIVVIAHCGFGSFIPGGLGVTIFFFLSGFLITSLLCIEYEKNGCINYKNFYIRRTFRLFPPLILLLVVSYLLNHLGLLGGEASFSSFLFQLFYLSNYAALYSWGAGAPDGLGVLWSLAVEEHFYLIFPIVLYFTKRYLSDKEPVMFLFILCICVLIWRIILVQFFKVSPSVTYSSTDTRIDSILYGCILALSLNPFKSESYDFIYNNRLLFKLLFFSALVVLLVTLFIRNDYFRETYRYSLQGASLFFIFSFVVFSKKGLVFKILSLPLLVKIGKYSYSIYLFHFVIIYLILQNTSISNNYFLLFLTAPSSYLVGKLINITIDNYFLKLRRKFHS